MLRSEKRKALKKEGEKTVAQENDVIETKRYFKRHGKRN
jgi:hypothetical protein